MRKKKPVSGKKPIKKNKQGKDNNQIELLYQGLVEHLLQGVMILQDFKIVYANTASTEITGYTIEELMSLTRKKIEALVHKNDRKNVWQRFQQRLEGKQIPHEYEHRTIRKDGSVLWVKSFASLLDFNNKPAVLATFVDITSLKKTEELLKERTVHLEDANAALKVLLNRMEIDKKELEKKMLENIKELVKPYLENLKKSDLDSRQQMNLEIIESNINDITTPLVRNLSSKFLNFTPMEIQVADLIKQGKSTKEIALFFNLAVSTIKTHRINIRKKVGLNKKKLSLQTYLLSLK